MQSLWDDKEAVQCRGELDLRVYGSRLLGRDKTLVLHGGGNERVIWKAISELPKWLLIQGSRKACIPSN